MKAVLKRSMKVYSINPISVRVDKDILELYKEKPTSRWDAPYWQPKYDALFKMLETKYSIDSLDKYISSIDQGDVPRKARGDKYVNKGIIYFNVVDIISTGILWINCKRIIPSHYKRIQRAEPKNGDLIFVRSGKGSIGKSTVFVGVPTEKKFGISGHLNTVRIKNINPYYVEIFLKSCFGQMQIERFESGTSQQTDFRQESFAALKIPIIPNAAQLNIETKYKKMVVYHDKAMETKSKGNDITYKKNIEKAETILKELIEKTESVIRGERKDVI